MDRSPPAGVPLRAARTRKAPDRARRAQIGLRLHRKLPRSAKKKRRRDGSCRPSLSSSPSGTGAGLVGPGPLGSMNMVDGKSYCVTFRPTVGYFCCRSTILLFAPRRSRWSARHLLVTRQERSHIVHTSYPPRRNTRTLHGVLPTSPIECSTASSDPSLGWPAVVPGSPNMRDS